MKEKIKALADSNLSEKDFIMCVDMFMEKYWNENQRDIFHLTEKEIDNLLNKKTN